MGLLVRSVPRLSRSQQGRLLLRRINMAYERMFDMYANDPTVSEIIDLMAAEMRSPGGLGQSPPSVRGWSISELRRHGYGALLILAGPDGRTMECSVSVAVSRA